VIEKEKLKKVILEYQQFIQTIELKKREYSLEEEANYVIVGPRRAGKTYFLYQHIREMVQSEYSMEDVVFINFEDERFLEFDHRDFDLIILAYRELFDKKPLLFFDEIHIMPGWEKFARRLADTGFRVFLTGSNAKMLSKDIATTLGGRFLTKEILPLSFKEFLSFQEIPFHPNDSYSPKLAIIKRNYHQYFTSGAFPETLLFKHSEDYLRNLYQKLLYGDILLRYGLRNDKALKLVIKKIAESIGDESSYRRITNLVLAAGIKIGTSTIIDYLGYLQEAYFIFGLTNYAAKFSEREAKKKYYFIDNGLLNLFLFDNNAFLLENLVFIELYRKYQNNFFFYKKKHEVDFYIPEKAKLVQVSFSLQHPETRKRELRALRAAAGDIEVKERLILTQDEDFVLLDGGISIKVLPVWKWMLSSINDDEEIK